MTDVGLREEEFVRRVVLVAETVPHFTNEFKKDTHYEQNRVSTRAMTVFKARHKHVLNLTTQLINVMLTFNKVNCQ